MISRMPCKFIASRVKPVIMANRMAKKMASIMPKLKDSKLSGKK